MTRLSTPTTRRSRLGLEALEDRCCPTTVNFINGTLLIVGDSNANNVNIVQNDNTNTLTVSYDFQIAGSTLTLSQAFASSDVKVISVNLGGGDDHFSHWVQSDFLYAKTILGNLGSGNDQATLGLGNVKANLTIDFTMGPTTNDGDDYLAVSFHKIEGAQVSVKGLLGGGNDEFRAQLYGDVTGPASVKFDVNGQDGIDELRVFGGFQRPKYHAPPDSVPIHVGAEALIDVNLQGGAGDDTVGLYFYAEIDGMLRHHLDGGEGVDVVLPMVTKLQGSTGVVVAY
jgi:hypothetical protein